MHVQPAVTATCNKTFKHRELIARLDPRQMDDRWNAKEHIRFHFAFEYSFFKNWWLALKLRRAFLKGRYQDQRTKLFRKHPQLRHLLFRRCRQLWHLRPCQQNTGLTDKT